MNIGKLIFYAICIISAVIMLIYYLRSERPAHSAVLGMGSGAVFLLLLHFFGDYVGFSVPLNFFTGFVSLILGIPGVMILALLIRFIF